MDLFEDEFEVKFNKRIKVEHSYARDDFIMGIIDEDPLKIKPVDVCDIKKEPEDEETIVIKTEPCYEILDEPTYDGIMHTEDALMEMMGSEPCSSLETKFIISNVMSVRNEDDLKNVDTNSGQFDSSEPIKVDTVPLHVFQELQKMYEKTVSDMKVLKKKVTDSKKKKPPQPSKNEAVNIKALRSDLKKLKEQLKDSKSNEQVLKKTLDIRAKDDNTVKKANNIMKIQLSELAEINKNHAVSIGELRRQLEKRDQTIKALHLSRRNVQKKDHECSVLTTKCKQLTQKLKATKTEIGLYRRELEKLQLDMDIMDKSIIDSGKTRLTLKDQIEQLEKQLDGLKQSPMATKLQETLKESEKLKSQADNFQMLLKAEQKRASILSGERDHFRRENGKILKESDMKLGLLKQTITVIRKSLARKTDSLKAVDEECRRIRNEFDLRREEWQRKENEFNAMRKELETKQCQYCGF